jgi:hypothetical protein
VPREWAEVKGKVTILCKYHFPAANGWCTLDDEGDAGEVGGNVHGANADDMIGRRWGRRRRLYPANSKGLRPSSR